MPEISVIIIARNEEQEISDLLPQISDLDNAEVIVVDGESTDRTREIAARHGCRCLIVPAGRARQLNAGACASSGDVLVFLHADCRLQRGWERELQAALEDPAIVGGAFSLAMSGGRPWLDRFLSWSGRANARRSQIFLGDHTLFVRREVFERAGGFPDVELMEDYLFSKELRRFGRLVQLQTLSLASSRRFVENGYLTTMMQMRLLRLLAARGYSSRWLSHRYLKRRGH